MPYKNSEDAKLQKRRWRAQNIDIDRALKKKYYVDHREKLNQRAKLKRTARRDWLREYKKTLKCEKCGFQHPAVIQFHHKNNDKNFTIGEPGSKSIERLKKEIAKYAVLCANCHLIHHYNEKQ